jgi:sugar phosphate isomerase/epimerase
MIFLSEFARAEAKLADTKPSNVTVVFDVYHQFLANKGL